MSIFDLSIVIVSFNQKKYLIRCLESIEESLAKTDLRVETWVVDNASIDESLEAVETSFPAVGRIRNGENLGFSKANNQAISKAGGRSLLLLNN
ncbi:MAG TPA: glycosyltransferase, partial [Chroococcales cyanobacterium]